MFTLDTHCDTISRILDRDEALLENSGQVDLERMERGHIQFFAAFIDPIYDANPVERCLSIIAKFYEEADKNRDGVMVCRSYRDMVQASRCGKYGAFLSLEGGTPIVSCRMLDMLYRLGVRCAALTWNRSNHLAGGALETGGLTPLGRDVVVQMQKIGMLMDVSHLNEESFWDVVSCMKQPFIASHSCSRAMCNHPRNLTDRQFRAICEAGGCVGINFYPEFLSADGNASVDDIICHIEHFLKLGGENHIGIGADFDGVNRLPEGIGGIQDVGKIFVGLQKRGHSRQTIEKIAYRNFARVIEKVL